MATAKKTVTKKTTAKKPAVRKAAPKPATKKRVVSMSEARKLQNEFMRFELTRETLHWAVLCVIVLSFGVWVVNATDQIHQIYDTVDATHADVVEIKSKINR